MGTDDRTQDAGLRPLEEGVRTDLAAEMTYADYLGLERLLSAQHPRSDHPDVEKQAGIVAIDQRVQAEDRALLEGVRPEFPLEITTEVHVKSDRMTLEYRKVLAELAAETTGVTPDAAWARRW